MLLARPLTPVELALHRLNEGAPLNFCTVVGVRGPLSESLLVGALAAAQVAHPYLRVRIVDHASRLYFTGEAVGPLPLRIASYEDWVKEVEREIAERLDWTRGPGARVVWLRGKGEHHRLLLTFHHVIGDGLSGVFLGRDIVACLDRAILGPARVGSTPPRPVVTEDLAPVQHRLSPRQRGWRGAWKRLGFAFRTLIRLGIYGPALRPRIDRSAEPSRRSVRVSSLRFDANVTRALVRRAREEGTTVHGVVSAAIVLAIAADAGFPRRRAAVFGSPVNLRDGLVPAAGESVGLFVSISEFRRPIDRDTSLWSLARSIRRDLVQDLQTGFPGAALALLAEAATLLGAGRVSPQVLVRRWASMFPNTGALTNLGRVEIPAGESFSVSELHFAVSPSGLGYLPCTATTFAGVLRLNVMWPEPCLDPAHALALVAEIERRVREAAGSG